MIRQEELREYRVWDRTTRWFHWINVVAVLGLTAAGLGILFDKELGLSIAGKAQLKTVHVLIGYVMVINLTWRLVWAFIGGANARWRAILPFGREWLTQAKAYVSALAGGREPNYAGHNPLARLAITIMLALLVTQAASGLVLAGTDLFYPPFGSWFAQQVAAPGVDPASLAPPAVVLAGSPQLIDAAALKQMRAFKEPFEGVHEYTFYALIVMIMLHVAAVVIAEQRGGGTLLSAMITGRKTLRGPPLDVAAAEQAAAATPEESIARPAAQPAPAAAEFRER